MGSQTILILLCIGLSAVQIVCGELWKFGTDNVPEAIVIAQYHGSFSFFQKEQRLQLLVPPCHVVTYVNVNVNNYISSPTVHYNAQTHEVVIHYNFWQISPSKYTITAKAAFQPGCIVSMQALPGQAFQQPPEAQQFQQA